MDKLLKYYYNFNCNLIKKYDGFFEYKNNKYIFQKINKIDLNMVGETKRFNCFFKIINNINNKIITEYNSELYVLLCINLKKNRIVNLNDIFFISSLNVNVRKYTDKNYQKLWERKIDYFENFLLFNNRLYDYINWNFYVGLAENAINYCKNINYNEIRYGMTYSRFNNIKTLYDLLNPINIQYGPVVNNISEYVKYLYFYENKEIKCISLFEMNLSSMDYRLLIGRLLFPTYFFDIFNNGLNYLQYGMISSKINDYIKYVKKIINEIKKRHIDMPSIEWF